jgi:Leucine-rich repeat (LRR) protein
MMRLPMEIAMEVGSFLDGPSLMVCTTQLCWSGVGFVSRPCTDSAKVTTIQLYNLLFLTASRTPGVGHEQADVLAIEAIKRIDLCLARRTRMEKVVFDANVTGLYGTANTDTYSKMHRHFQVSSNLQFNNGPSLAVEWHANAKSISAITFLLGARNDGHLDDGGPLASCQSLHALDLRHADVSDVSTLASCQALHTLNLFGTRVNDVSALASCPALHTLDLALTKVSDVSALASCHALRKLDLAHTQVSDVAALASCQALQTLDLNSTQVSDVSVLASCQVLRTLDLAHTQVSDVAVLASCQALHTLDLADTQVSDVAALASCQALHTLRLIGTPVSDVSALASCQALHTLYLDYSQVSDVSALVACGSLRCLHGCEHMLGYEAIARLLEDRR